MKRLLFLFSVLFFGLNVQADRVLTEEQWNQLPSETREKINFQKNSESADKWANIGKQIGIAVNECLNAIEKSAQRISNTRLGRVAIGIVIWKLLYGDILQIVVGIFLLVLSVISWRRWQKATKDDDEAAFATNVVCHIVYFISSLVCLFA